MKDWRGTWRFWLWGFVFLFLAHAFAILRFSERPRATASRPATHPFFHFSLDAASDHRVAELTGWRDPMLFALPHAQGFSGGAWLRYRPEGLNTSNWSAQPDWLPLPVEGLGGSLQRFIATNQTSEEGLLDSLRAPALVVVRLPDEPLITNTSVRIEGPLSNRGVLSLPSLPSAVSAEVLRRSMVMVSVDGDGRVETAALTASSGSRVADGQAVDVARHFAFEPLPIRKAQARELAALTIGRLIFTWHVTTNSVLASMAP